MSRAGTDTDLGDPNEYARRLGSLANDITLQISQGGNHTIRVTEETRDDVLIAAGLIKMFADRGWMAMGDKYAIVPRHPTNKMIVAALEAWDLGKRGYTEQWSAMIDASQTDPSVRGSASSLMAEREQR